MSVNEAGLRERLLDLAEAELAKSGHEDLSLRSLAAEAAVAASAPYKHFAGRADFLKGLADRGYLRLLASYEEAAQFRGSPIERLDLAVRGFMRLAEEQPNLFELMFSSTALRGSSPSDVARASFRKFQELVGAVSPADGQQERLRGLALWSYLHGLASLAAGGRFMRSDEGIVLSDLLKEYYRLVI